MNLAIVSAAIFLYFAAVISLSLWAARKNRGSADFFRGGRRSPWPVVAVAMVGTSISGVTFVSVPGMVEASAFSYLQMALGFVAGYAVIAFLLLPLYYRLNLTSLYEYLEMRFGLCSHKTGAVFFLLSKVLGCGVKMYLTAIVLQLVLFDPLGVPFAANVGLTMLLVWLYTFRGGVRSLVWTDMIQTLCMLGCVVLCIVFVCRAAGFSLAEGCRSIAESPMSRIWFFDDPRDTRYFWKQFLAGMFTTVAMTGLDQDMMQKNLSCRNLRESRRNVLSYGVAFIPVNLLFLALGVLLSGYAAANGIYIAKPDDLFPTIACGTGTDGAPFMPPAVSLLFVLGLVSAAFSSSGSSLTSITTTFTLDILKAGNRQDEAGLKRTRNFVHAGAAIVMGAVICAYRAIGDESVINAVYTISGYTYGPLLGLFLFGIFTRRNPREAWVPPVCIASPLLCMLLSANSEQWFGGWRIGFELLLINCALTMLGLWLAGLGRAEQRKTPADSQSTGV